MNYEDIVADIDQLVSIVKSMHASSADKQLKLYEGYNHDLLNDKYHGIVFRDILRWLNEKV